MSSLGGIKATIDVNYLAKNRSLSMEIKKIFCFLKCYLAHDVLKNLIECSSNVLYW